MRPVRCGFPRSILVTNIILYTGTYYIYAYAHAPRSVYIMYYDVGTLETSNMVCSTVLYNTGGGGYIVYNIIYIHMCSICVGLSIICTTIYLRLYTPTYNGLTWFTDRIGSSEACWMHDCFFSPSRCSSEFVYAYIIL
jgi:hypothetical protein